MMLLKLEFLVAHAIERVAFKSKEQELLTDICYENWFGHYNMARLPVQNQLQ